MRAGFLVALVTLLGSLNALAADDRWIEVKSPHFTVVSNGSDKTARNVAWQLEQIRAAIQAGWPWARVQLDRPVTVVAAKDAVVVPDRTGGSPEQLDRPRERDPVRARDSINTSSSRSRSLRG